jgi:hypothetical protein
MKPVEREERVVKPAEALPRRLILAVAPAGAGTAVPPALEASSHREAPAITKRPKQRMFVGQRKDPFVVNIGEVAHGSPRVRDSSEDALGRGARTGAVLELTRPAPRCRAWLVPALAGALLAALGGLLLASLSWHNPDRTGTAG